MGDRADNSIKNLYYTKLLEQGLESSFCRMSQVNVELGVFQEMKIMVGIFVREPSGYFFTATETPISHCGGVAVFYCKAEHFYLDALCLHETIAVSF